MQVIHTKYAPEAIGPYSQAIIINHILYCSGQIPLSPETGEVHATEITAQTEQVIANIQAILTEVGIGFEQVFKTTCFLTNMENFKAFNQVYEKYFISKPSRSCVAVKELPKQVLIEIEVMAYIK